MIETDLQNHRFRLLLSRAETLHLRNLHIVLLTNKLLRVPKATHLLIDRKFGIFELHKILSWLEA